MLSRDAGSRAHGFTLVELLVGIAIMAALMALAMPGFSIWMQNTQIRTAAEALQNGVQLARAEAVRRNSPVMFQLTTTLDGSCTLVATGQLVNTSNWVVSLTSAVSHCGDKASADLPTPLAPGIVQTRAGGDGSKNVQIKTDNASIVFNGLGHLTSSSSMTVRVSNNTAGCGPSGSMRCLQLSVSAQGQTLMCDPQLAAGVIGACS